jgi:hypothetical protein
MGVRFGTRECPLSGVKRIMKFTNFESAFAHALTDIEYEIEPTGEAVASVRYPH